MTHKQINLITIGELEVATDIIQEIMQETKESLAWNLEMGDYKDAIEPLNRLAILDKIRVWFQSAKEVSVEIGVEQINEIPF